eukprot:GILJ01018302.1.p2 GENE.GILJ01018302.1~~GILJ01018302.1.p2  ORF type:complete len:196 (-),score=13.03 GILJ01018302.1:790-1377(-)
MKPALHAGLSRRPKSAVDLRQPLQNATSHRLPRKFSTGTISSMSSISGISGISNSSSMSSLSLGNNSTSARTANGGTSTIPKARQSSKQRMLLACVKAKQDVRVKEICESLQPGEVNIKDAQGNFGKLCGNILFVHVVYIDLMNSISFCRKHPLILRRTARLYKNNSGVDEETGKHGHCLCPRQHAAARCFFERQ